MSTFNTEFDKGEYPSDNYEVIQCTVNYSISKFVPGNYDHPDEGGELEDIIFTDLETGEIIPDAEIPQKHYDRIVEACYDHHDKHKHDGRDYDPD